MLTTLTAMLIIALYIPSIVGFNHYLGRSFFFNTGVGQAAASVSEQSNSR